MCVCNICNINTCARIYTREKTSLYRLLILVPFFHPESRTKRTVDARGSPWMREILPNLRFKASSKQNAPSVCVSPEISVFGFSWPLPTTPGPARVSVSTRGVRASAPARALSSHPTRRRCPSSRPKSRWPALDPARPLVVPGIRVSTFSRAYLRDAIGAASAAPRLPRASASARPPKAPPAARLARSQR